MKIRQHDPRQKLETQKTLRFDSWEAENRKIHKKIVRPKKRRELNQCDFNKTFWTDILQRQAFLLQCKKVYNNITWYESHLWLGTAQLQNNSLCHYVTSHSLPSFTSLNSTQPGKSGYDFTPLYLSTGKHSTSDRDNDNRHPLPASHVWLSSPIF